MTAEISGQGWCVFLKMATFNCFLTRGVGFEDDEGRLSLPGSCGQFPGTQKVEVA